MINIVNKGHDPFFNLALEEYILKQKPIDDYVVILWQSTPSIVIGKHQNPFQEIDGVYVGENNIDVLRRISGGGAVYHDLGNLNFTCIVHNCKTKTPDFAFFAGPVIACLQQMGISAQANSRNDITAAGRKFSGNARYLYKYSILHHGTILFDSDLKALRKALRPQENYTSRAVKSARSQVVNLREMLRADMDITTFKSFLTDSFFAYHKAPFSEYRLTGEDVAAVERLSRTKYQTWEWLYGHSPEMEVQKEIVMNGNRLSVILTVKSGIITKCASLPANLPLQAADKLSRQLIGQRFDHGPLALS